MKNPLTPERIARDSHEWTNQTIASAAWQRAAQSPDEVAIYLEHDPHITYGAIAEEALRLVTGLRKLGLEQGDVISFQLPNWRESVVLDIATSAMGLVVFFNSPALPTLLFTGARGLRRHR